MTKHAQFMAALEHYNETHETERLIGSNHLMENAHGHSALPWKIGTCGDLVQAESEQTIALFYAEETENIYAHSLENAEANSEFIARACNTYYALLDACRAVAECKGEFQSGKRDGGLMGRVSEAMDKAQAALLKTTE